MSFIEKLKDIKLRLVVIISIVVLCLIFGGVGVVKYTNAAHVKEGLALGNKYLQEEKYEEAILEFAKIIEIEPKNVEARVGLAKAYVKVGKLSEAEMILKEAISINPKKEEPYMELAKLYINRNELESAIKALTDGYKVTNSASIKLMLEDLKAKIIISDISKTIIMGESYSLPKQVTVKVNNTETQYPVKWNMASVDASKVGANEVSGTLENTDKVIKLTINVIGIASIENISSVVNLNDKYSLPSKVTAKMTDGSAREVEVTWSPINVDTTTAGIYNYEGSVSGYNNRVKLSLNVIGISSIDNINVTINQKDKYSLPSKVTAKMTDGSTQEVEVGWSPSSVDTSKAGTYSYQGTVDGYSNKVKLTLNIKSLQNDSDYTEAMAVELAKKHIGAAGIDDVAGYAMDSVIKDGKKYYYVRLYSKSMRQEGGTGTIDFFYIARDGSVFR